MNGDSLQLYNKLKEDFAILKTQFDERWRAHDISSQGRARDYYTRFDDIKQSVTEIIKKLDALPCGKRMVEIKSLSDKVNLLEKLVVVVIFVGIVLGVWLKYANMG